MRNPLQSIALCCVLAGCAGCYNYVPIAPGDLPPAGEPVALDISDAGRVGLTERFGPGLLRVEGRLTSAATQEYALNVHRVAFLGAPSTRWSGELVRIDRGFVGRVQRRELSKGRTAFTIGLAVATVVAVFITTDLVGFFQGSDNEPPEPPPPSSNRVGH